MKIDIADIVRQLVANAATIRSLVETVSDEQAQWKPDIETWCLKEVMEHIYNEERIDFRKHLIEMLSDPPQPWKDFSQEEYISVETCRQALEEFLAERTASLAWLNALKSVDWDTATQTPFRRSLSAGDVLTSWVAHDYLHLRQINELFYAWNQKQALPYSVQYAGDW